MEHNIQGAGLGMRREFIKEFLATPNQPVDFLEIAPENWMTIGGARSKDFKSFIEQYPTVCHGLSLSIGSPDELDEKFILAVKHFLDQHNIALYTEHLSYCSNDGHLYDLLPIPFTEEAVHYVASRIRRVQELLERRIYLENVSYYAAPGQELSEINFTNAVMAESDCGMLLDVNNIYVNSINHKYDPKEFIALLDPSEIAYIHIAGHYDESNTLKIDTHGDDVIANVWDLLAVAYEKFGVLPTLLERDFNFPSLSEIFDEVSKIQKLQATY